MHANTRIGLPDVLAISYFCGARKDIYIFRQLFIRKSLLPLPSPRFPPERHPAIPAMRQ